MAQKQSSKSSSLFPCSSNSWFMTAQQIEHVHAHLIVKYKANMPQVLQHTNPKQNCSLLLSGILLCCASGWTRTQPKYTTSLYEHSQSKNISHLRKEYLKPTRKFREALYYILRKGWIKDLLILPKGYVSWYIMKDTCKSYMNMVCGRTNLRRAARQVARCMRRQTPRI
jgi:hypothetical protein